VTWGGQSAGTFLDQTQYFVDAYDVWSGIIKAAFFGLIIFLIACHQGYHASGGAKGVGQATTKAVVSASIAIFVSDYFLTVILLL
jgi:phospholipid/cholesterol/gamma-HCH transport system permease protein